MKFFLKILIGPVIRQKLKICPPMMTIMPVLCPSGNLCKTNDWKDEYYCHPFLHSLNFCCQIKHSLNPAKNLFMWDVGHIF